MIKINVPTQDEFKEALKDDLRFVVGVGRAKRIATEKLTEEDLDFYIRAYSRTKEINIAQDIYNHLYECVRLADSSSSDSDEFINTYRETVGYFLLNDLFKNIEGVTLKPILSRKQFELEKAAKAVPKK